MTKWIYASIVFIGFIIGFISGALVSDSTYHWRHSGDTTVYTVKEAITVEHGIILPIGTQLIHDVGMDEGFNRLKLYINVDPMIEKKFQVHSEKGPLIIPYWVYE